MTSSNLTLENILIEIGELREDQKKSVSDFNCSYENLNEKLCENMDLLKKQSEDLKLYRDEVDKFREENSTIIKKKKLRP